MEGDEDRLAAEELLFTGRLRGSPSGAWLGADHDEDAACAGWWRSGILQVTPVGTSYLYRPARPAWQSLAGAADTLLENTIEGLDGKLLAYMVKKSRLTPDDLTQLRAILDEHTTADGENGEAPP